MGECKRLTVRAIGITDGSIVESGGNYNKGVCTGEAGNCGCIHAEIDLLTKMPNPDIVVVSHSPCLNCAKELVKAGVKAVYFMVSYRKTEGLDYLIANEVKTFYLSAQGAHQL